MKARAGGAGRRDVVCAGVDSSLLGTLKREPDRGDLRVGEDHARRAVVVARCLRLVAGDHLRGHARLVGPHVRE